MTGILRLIFLSDLFRFDDCHFSSYQRYPNPTSLLIHLLSPKNPVILTRHVMILPSKNSNVWGGFTILYVVIVIWYLKPSITTQLQSSNWHGLHGKITPYNYRPLWCVYILMCQIPFRDVEETLKNYLNFDETFSFI